MKKLIIHNLILDLSPIPIQLLIHALPFLSITESNDPVYVIVG